METFGTIPPNVPLRFKNKQEHTEGLDCEIPGCDHPSQSDYTFDRGGHEWMIGTCKHHDHVEHALNALNHEIEQMAPVVNAAAMTKEKRYMYNSYEPEDYDYLDEASKRDYVNKYGEVSDYDYEGTTDPEEVVKAAEAEHGAKFANQLKGVGKPRTKDSGIDPLGRLAGNKETRATKTGKANRQDVEALKGRIKARLGVKTVTTNRHGGDWAKRTYVKEEHLEEASIPKHLLGRYKKMVKRYADSIHDKHPDYSDDKKFRIASATAMKVLGVTEETKKYKSCPHCKGTGEVFPEKDSKPSKVPGICINCNGQGILNPMEEAYQRPPRKITSKLTGRVAKKGYDAPDSEKVTNIVQGIRQFNVQNFLKDLPRNTPESVKRQHALAANPKGYPKVRMGKQVAILVGSHGDQSEAGKRAGELSNFLMQQGHETQPFVTQGQNGYNYGVRPVVSKPGAKSMKEQLSSDDDVDYLEEAEATYCRRCGTKHVEPSMGGKCPALEEQLLSDEELDRIDQTLYNLGENSDIVSKIRNKVKQYHRERTAIQSKKDLHVNLKSYDDSHKNPFIEKQYSKSMTESFELSDELITESAKSPYYNAGRKVYGFAKTLGTNNRYFAKVNLHAKLLMSSAGTHHETSAQNVHKLPPKYRDKILLAVLQHSPKSDAQKYLKKAGYTIAKQQSK